MSWDMVIVLDPDQDDAEFSFVAANMGRIRRAMTEAGMLVTVDPPVFPKAADFGLTMDELVRCYRAGPDSPDIPDAVHALKRANQVVRDRTEERPSGIPAYKFASNDRWLVSPAEIRAALAVYDGLAPAEQKGLFGGWDDWIAFLRRAVDRGGFRVE